MVVRWKPLDISGAEFQSPRFPMKLLIPFQETLPDTFYSALGSGGSTVAGIWSLGRKSMNLQIFNEYYK